MTVAEGAAEQEDPPPSGDLRGPIPGPQAAACPLPDSDPLLPALPAPLGEADRCGRPTSRARRLVRRALPLVAGAGIVVVAVSAGPTLAGTARALGRVSLAGMGLAVAAEVACYLSFSLHIRLLAGRADNARRAAPLRLALVMFGLGSVLPAAPAEGMMLAGSALRRRRLDPRRAAAVIGYSQWFSMRGLFALASCNAVVAVALGDVPRQWAGGALGAALLTLALLLLASWLSTRRRVAESVASLAIRVTHWRNCPPAAERRARGEAWRQVALHVAGSRRRRAALIATTVLAWLCDGVCLALAVRALGVDLGLDQVLLAYAAGRVAANAPFVPGGLGVVETVVPLVLVHYGVHWPDALGAVLLYRMAGTLLPAAAGAAAVLGLRCGTAAAAPAHPPVTAVIAAGALGAPVAPAASP